MNSRITNSQVSQDSEVTLLNSQLSSSSCMEMEDDVKPILDAYGNILGNINGESAPTTSTVIYSNVMNSMMAEILEKSVLNCRFCGKFFTTAVFSVPTHGTVCETCVLAHKWKGGRLEIYDIMLKNLPVVPCPHAGDGCNIQMLPETSVFHQVECKYRPIKCITPGCPWVDKQSDFTEHFLDKHRKDVMNDTTTIDLAQESFVIVKFFIRNNSKYFLIIKHQQGSLEVLYKILSVNESDARAAAIKHFCNNSDTYIVQIDTQELNAIDKECAWKKVSLLVLKMMFEGNNILSISVKVSHLSKVEEKLRCFGCGKTMRPHIYQCEEGHGVCSTCSSELEQCSICQKGINRTRHCELESLTNNVLYHCVHQPLGCKAIISGGKINQHEATCRHRLISCLWPKCGYKNNYGLFKQHIVDLHKKTPAVNTLTYIIPDYPANDIRSYIYVDDCLFELKVKVARKNPLEWQISGTIHLMNKELCKSKYLCKYVIISSGNKEEFSGKFLFAKEKSNATSFQYRFRKDTTKRTFCSEFIKSNL